VKRPDPVAQLLEDVLAACIGAMFGIIAGSLFLSPPFNL
jgi:hypothetical protein